MPAVSSAILVSEQGLTECVEITADGFSGPLKWQSDRVLDPKALTIEFVRLDPATPLKTMRGCWKFLSVNNGVTVRLEHDYELSDPAREADVEKTIASNVTRDLEGLKAFAEARLPQTAVVITGASQGIGLAISKQIAAGERVLALGARNISKLQEVRENLLKEYPDRQVLIHSLDVEDTESVQAFFRFVNARVGRVDVLVNNAGIGGGGRTVDLPEMHWMKILNTNLNGVYRCTKEYLALWSQEVGRRGRVINIASTGGKQGVVHAAAYCASKHAVVGLTKSLGLEYAKSGVTFNAVCPGFVETELAAGARQRYAALQGITSQEMKTRIEARIPMGRYSQPDEVAAAVEYFMSPSADIVTGQTLNVCGGLGNY